MLIVPYYMLWGAAVAWIGIRTILHDVTEPLGSLDYLLITLLAVLLFCLGATLGSVPLALLETGVQRYRRMAQRHRGWELATELRQWLWFRRLHVDQYGQLWTTDMDGRRPGLVVRVVDPADGAVRWLRVPPDMQTAHEAVAWTYRMPPHLYHPSKRT